MMGLFKKRQPEPTVYIPPISVALLQDEAKKADRERREYAAAQREAERMVKARAEKQQAAADIDFLIGQIDSLHTMLWDADAALEAAQKQCDYDDMMNSAGAVITQKAALKHKADRDKLARRVLQLESSIHNKEAKLAKAQRLVRG